MKIGSFEIGIGKTFIIAELSANHGGSYETAVKTIEAAAQAGVDAIKLQTYTADTITVNNKNIPELRISNGTLWDGETYYDLYKRASTPWKWQEDLKKIADSLGLILFSSPFDYTAVDFLEKLNVPAYKIASFEINDLSLIKYTASKNKPVIISTGVANKEEITNAVNACKSVGNEDIILLKCTSSYPAPLEEANIKMIPEFIKDYNCLAGLSDHTLNNIVAISAVASGASVIEKHFILDKSINSPDKEFSLDEKEMKKFVEDIRLTEKILGSNNYEVSMASKNGRTFMRSLYAIKDIEKGDIFSYSNIASFRPALGVDAKYLDDIIGKKSTENIKANYPLKDYMIEK